MRRTNNKEVNKFFDEYLMDVLEADYDGKLDGLQKQFYNACSGSDGKLYRKFTSYQDAFMKISMNNAPYYEDMRNYLKEALDETEEEAEKYSNTEVENEFNYLLYKAFLRKCEKENTVVYKYFK